MSIQNPFILAVGLMNLGAAVWYLYRDAPVMGIALVVYAIGAVVQSLARVG